MASGRHLSKPLMQKDNVHGSFVIPHPIQVLINTKEFHRLEHVKQLALACYVYPTAQHTRAEHSKGVFHLAEKFITTIKNNQPELGIGDDEILVISVAALCHDLGHGPFSHAWETCVTQNGKHEQMTCALLQHMWDNNPQVQNLLTSQQLELVQALVNPDDYRHIYEREQARGRGYLFEIVSNPVCKVDVDKIDYLLRDSLNCGYSANLDVDRIFNNARVVSDQNGHSHICYNEKVSEDIMDIFLRRYEMHKKVYQHKTVVACELMIRDIVKLANPHEHFVERSQECRRFLQLDDRLLYTIKTYGDRGEPEEELDPGMLKARQLVERLEDGAAAGAENYGRPFYKCVLRMYPLGFSTLQDLKAFLAGPRRQKKEQNAWIRRTILENYHTQLAEQPCEEYTGQLTLREDDIEVVDGVLGFGGDVAVVDGRLQMLNPIEKVPFFKHSDPVQFRYLKSQDVSLVQGGTAAEGFFCVYLKNLETFSHDEYENIARMFHTMADQIWDSFQVHIATSEAEASGSMPTYGTPSDSPIKRSRIPVPPESTEKRIEEQIQEPEAQAAGAPSISEAAPVQNSVKSMGHGDADIGSLGGRANGVAGVDENSSNAGNTEMCDPGKSQKKLTFD